MNSSNWAEIMKNWQLMVVWEDGKAQPRQISTFSILTARIRRMTEGTVFSLSTRGKGVPAFGPKSFQRSLVPGPFWGYLLFLSLVLSGGYSLFFQRSCPKYCIRSGCVAGAVYLLRSHRMTFLF